jgi:hypothetical protein
MDLRGRRVAGELSAVAVAHNQAGPLVLQACPIYHEMLPCFGFGYSAVDFRQSVSALSDQIGMNAGPNTRVVRYNYTNEAAVHTRSIAALLGLFSAETVDTLDAAMFLAARDLPCWV